MTFTFFRFTWHSPKELKIFGKDNSMIEFIKAHEKHHRQHWWRLPSNQDEIDATIFAFETLSDRHEFKDLLSMEVDYRIWSKYGIRASEFAEVMEKKYNDKKQNTKTICE